MFPKLEHYILKPKETLELEYANVIKKPGFCPDIDPLLMVIFHDFILNENILNDHEVKLVSLLVTIRRAGGTILFEKFFPAMRDEVVNHSICNREYDSEKIREVVKQKSISIEQEPLNFANENSSTPVLKNTVMCSYASPSINERYSLSDDFDDVPFHITNVLSPSSSQVPVFGNFICQHQNHPQTLSNNLF